MTTQQAVEKTKENLENKITEVMENKATGIVGEDGLTVFDFAELRDALVKALSSLIDEEKGEREFVLYCPKCRSTMEKIKMVTNSQEKE